MALLLTKVALARVAWSTPSQSSSFGSGPFLRPNTPKVPTATRWSHDLVKDAVVRTSGDGQVAIGECVVEKPRPMSKGCTWQLGCCRVGTNMWTANCTAWRGDYVNKVVACMASSSHARKERHVFVCALSCVSHVRVLHIWVSRNTMTMSSIFFYSLSPLLASSTFRTCSIHRHARSCISLCHLLELLSHAPTVCSRDDKAAEMGRVFSNQTVALYDNITRLSLQLNVTFDGEDCGNTWPEGGGCSLRAGFCTYVHVHL